MRINVLLILFVFISNISIELAIAQTSNDTIKKMESLSTSPLSTPGMSGPLTINPQPLKLHSGFIGDIYISGVVSGLLQLQDNVSPGDKDFHADLSNGQFFVQKIEGRVQFFVQVGSYSIPYIGLPYVRSGNTNKTILGATNIFYGVVPQGFLKIAPTNNFSVLVGKLPTLMGAEYTFSFENMNIERGLLWNQENAVNRGIQTNYKKGQLAFSLSWNDGFYSNVFSWVSGSLTYTLNNSNTLAFVGSGNTQITKVSSFATPLYNNNEQLYNLIYTHISGHWTILPYLQYTKVPKSNKIFTSQDAETFGAALFVNYSFRSDSTDRGFSLPVRLEYINSTGSIIKGAPNLLYGQSSNAISVTITPTYQYKRFYGRVELSHVKANKTTSGLAFGSDGNKSSQSRMLLEIGLLF